MQDHEQLALLLKSEAGFERIMELLLDKYRSYGEHRGKIDLHDASTIECEALNAFVSPKKFFKPPELSFKVSDFERAISESPYPNATLKAVLEAYFNQPIMTSSERNQRRQSLWEEFVGAISEKVRGTTCVDWLTAMFGSRKYGYHIVLTEYKADVRAAEALLSNVCRVVNARYACDFAWIQLAVLGADMTGDSHWFDSDRAGGKLLLNAITFFFHEAEGYVPDNRQTLYDFFGIETNGISGTATVFSISFFDGSENKHPGFEAFANRREPVTVSEINLRNINYARSANKIVYAVENPSVFTVLTEYIPKESCGLICTFGQIRTVVARLIELLLAGGCVIYYAGDFDPEGLQIADKLMTTHENGSVIPWRMSMQDYMELQKNKEIISDRRLSILHTIQSPCLKKTAEAILNEKHAAYQELLIKHMINDVVQVKRD